MSRGELVLPLVVAAGAALLLVQDHRATPYDAIFERVGKDRDVPPDLLRAIARWESGFNANAVSPENNNGTRDRGLMQINDATARSLGLDAARILEPAYNVEAAGELLARLRLELGPDFSLLSWVAAYNAGSPAIKRRGIFNETYAAMVSWHFNLYQLARLLGAPGRA